MGTLIPVMIPRVEWAANARNRKMEAKNLWNMMVGGLVNAER